MSDEEEERGTKLHKHNNNTMQRKAPKNIYNAVMTGYVWTDGRDTILLHFTHSSHFLASFLDLAQEIATLGLILVMGMTTISGGIDWLGWHGAGYLEGLMSVAVAVAVGVMMTFLSSRLFHPSILFILFRRFCFGVAEEGGLNSAHRLTCSLIFGSCTFLSCLFVLLFSLS